MGRWIVWETGSWQYNLLLDTKVSQSVRSIHQPPLPSKFLLSATVNWSSLFLHICTKCSDHFGFSVSGAWRLWTDFM